MYKRKEIRKEFEPRAKCWAHHNTGKIFFLAKSPEAPRITNVMASCCSSAMGMGASFSNPVTSGLYEMAAGLLFILQMLKKIYGKE